MRKHKKLPERTINIWNRYDFAMCGLGHKNHTIAKIKHARRCLTWSCQRIIRGYADIDVWDMYGYLQKLIPAMLQTLKDTRVGSPAWLDDNIKEHSSNTLSDQSCHEKWDKILDRMIFLWQESDETTCRKKNPYEKAYNKASEKFRRKYGLFGQKLQTKAECKENQKHHRTTLHTMDEVPEFKAIHDKYFTRERALEKYREACKNEAIDMLKKYFFALWD